MAKTIENKVVSLELDDSKFSSKIEGVLKNVTRLKEGMNFKTATNGLDGITPAANNAAKGVNGLVNSVKNVNTTVTTTASGAAASTANIGAVAKQTSTNFTMLGGAASVALGNIAAKAITAGGSLLSSFAFGPILDGFREYENQLNAVQTIQANTFSKGETVATINAALDELNQYADRTIYSFSEMTKNIGMFTSAGVGLKESVASIKGLSNVAAMSGASSAQAATAMYQLSQALSTGVVKLQDWNSIVNAGMGGEQFQESLKRTARTYGIEVDKMIEENGSFRNSLKDGWLTSQVMIETLAQYTGDLSKEQLLNAGYTEEQAEQIMKLAETANDAATKVKTFAQLMDTVAESLGSGWASLFRTFFGDFERARTLWTGVSDVINGGISAFFDSLQGILDRWDELGGWYEWWYALMDLWKAASKPIAAIGNAVKDVFTGDAGAALFEFSKFLHHEIANWLIMSDQMASDIGRIFKMVAQIIWPVVKALFGFGAAIGQVVVAAIKIGLILVGALVKPLLQVGGKISEIVDVFANWFSQMTGGTDILGALGSVLHTVVGWVQSLADWFVQLTSLAIAPFFNGIRTVIEAVLPPIGEFFGVLKDAVKNVFGPLVEGLTGLGGSFDAFLNDTSSPFGKITKIVQDWGISFYKSMEGVAKEIGPKWSAKVKAFGDSIKPITENLGKGLGTAVENASKALGSFWEESKPGLLLAWNEIIKSVSEAFKRFGEKIKEVGDVIANFFGSQIDAIKNFGHAIGDSFKRIGEGLSFSSAFSGISEGFMTMIDSFGPLGDLIEIVVDLFGQLGRALKNLKDNIFEGVTTSGSLLNKVLGGFAQTIRSAFDAFGILGAVLVGVAKGFTTLATACATVISNLIEGLTSGLSAIKEFATSSEAFASFKKNIGDALNGVGDMVKGFWSGLGDSLKSMSLSDILSGALLGGGLGMGFKTLQNLLGGFQKITDSASGLMGKIEGVFGELKTALSTLTEAIKAKTLRDIAVSILILVGALFILAMLPADRLIQGAVAIGVLAKILTTALTSMFSIKTDLKKMSALFGAIFLLSGALVMLAIATAIMGSMDIKTLGQGLIAIGLMVEGMSRVVEKLSSKEKKMVSGVAALLGMAIAINLLVAPVALLGLLPTRTLIQGLVAVGLLMAGIAAFVKYIDDSKDSLGQMVGTAVLLNQLAGAIAILAGVVALLGTIPTDNLIQGILGMASVMAIMVLSVNNIEVESLTGVFSLVIMAGAMLIAAKALKEIASMSWGDYLSAVIRLGLVIAGLVYAANSAEASLEGVGAVALLAGAVLLLAGALSIIGGMSMEQIGTALIGLAGGLLILLGAAAIAEYVAPGLLALALAIAAIGATVIGVLASITILVLVFTAFISAISLAGPAIGTGMVAIASGIAAGAAIIAAASPAIEAALIGVANAVRNAAPALGEALMALVKAFGPVLVELIKQLGNGIRQLAKEVIRLINEQGPGMISALIGFLVELLTQLAANLPTIVAKIFEMLDTLLTAIDEYLPVLGQHLVSWLTSIIEFLQQLVPMVIQFVLNLVIGIVNALAESIPQMVEAGVNLISAWLTGMASMAAGIIDAAFNALITFINAFSDAIDKRGPELKAAVWKLVNSIANFLFGDIANIASDVGSKAASIGGNIIDGIKRGINNAKNAVINTMRNLASSCLDTVKSFLGIHSPSRKFAEVAKFMMLGMSKGLGDNEDTVYRDLKDISEKILDTMDLNMDYSPVIKPTVDTSEIQGLRDLELSGIHTSVIGSSVQNGSQMQQEIRALREELKSNQTPMVFNQYNQSPKALDLRELYRQTERQLERMGRL
jgi:tape measure domain-containing protein|nr:MAG TPA: tail tape measure [Caudoviricetes sp.]